MEEINLPVPYKSQWDKDAIISNNDCGSASVAMVLNFYGENLTTDQVQTKTGAGGGLVNIDELLKAVSSWGYLGEFYINQKMENLYDFLSQGLVPIVLIHYGSLTSTQDKGFRNGHFMPIVGIRPDGSVYANDPNFKDPIRQDGDHHVYTKDEFMQAWGDCHLDANPDFSLIIIRKNKIGSNSSLPKKIIVASPIGVNARLQPSIPTDPKQGIQKVYKQGTILDVVDRVNGDKSGDSNLWYQIQDGGKLYFVWSGAVSPVEETPVAPVSPVTPVVPATPAPVVPTPQPLGNDADTIAALQVVYKTTRDILISKNALPAETVVDTGFWASLRRALNI